LFLALDADNLQRDFLGCGFPLRLLENPIILSKPCDGLVFLHLSHRAWFALLVLFLYFQCPFDASEFFSSHKLASPVKQVNENAKKSSDADPNEQVLESFLLMV
jgi:hypothetical protein